MATNTRLDPVTSDEAIQMFGDYLIAVDSGNGNCNGVRAMGNGRSRTVAEMSVTAAMNDDTLGLEFEHDVDYTVFNGGMFATGSAALKFSREALSASLSTERAGNPHHMMFIAKACADLGVTDGSTVQLLTFAPPRYYQEAKANIIQALETTGNKMTIQRKGHDPITFKVNVSVYPESAIAAFAFAFDKHGDPVDDSLLKGRVLIVDYGAFTVDAVEMIDGSLNPAMLKHATWARNGTDTHIRRRVLADLRKEGYDHLTVFDVDAAIIRGTVTGEYAVDIDGVNSVDISRSVQKHSLQYAHWTVDNIFGSAHRDLEDIAKVFLVGGGASLVQPILKVWYDDSDKIVTTNDSKLTKGIHPMEINAHGALRYALHERNKQLSNPPKKKRSTRKRK